MQFWAVTKSNPTWKQLNSCLMFFGWQMLKKHPVETTKGQISFVFSHISTGKERECCTICMVCGNILEFTPNFMLISTSSYHWTATWKLFRNCFIISVPKCGVANQPLFSANNPHSKITTCHCLPPKKGGSQVTFVKGPLGRKVPSHLQATPRIVGRSRTHRLETHPPVETETDAEMERDLILRCWSSWWFQPLCKILVKLGIFPK